jgi:hypothetical protein
MTTIEDRRLVQGRECGACTACCVDLNIDAPELVKLADQACRHCTGAGCGIYDRRPAVCRDFHCGWRRISWLGEEWRPDRIGVMVRYLDPAEALPHNPDVEIAIALDLRRADRQLVGPALAEVCTRLIGEDVPTFLTVPGAPGYAAGRVHLNEPMAPIIATRNAGLIVQALGIAFDSALQHTDRRVVFAHGPAGEGSGPAS